METNPNTEPNSKEFLLTGRKDTRKIVLLLSFSFLCLLVSLFMGVNNNIPSAISSLLLILAFSKLAEFNPSDTNNDIYHKYFWVSYLLTGITFVFAIKCYLSSFILFDSDFGKALMWIALGVYFVCFKPTKNGFGYRILKALGIILLALSVATSYIASPEHMVDLLICLAMFVLGTLALYFANRPFLREVFKD